MSDEPSLEDRARDMGWRPKEEYRGNAEWVDAETYVKRGESMMPFLRANNRRLEEEVRALRASDEEKTRLLRANTSALDQLLKASNEREAEAAEDHKKDLISEITTARHDGDVEKEEALREQLENTNARIKAAKSTPAGGTVTSGPSAGTAEPGREDFTQRQEWKDFSAANPEIVQDPVALATANAIMINMISKGEITAQMSPTERWQKVADAARKRLGLNNQRREEPSRVEGTRPSGEGSSERGSARKSYQDLPAEAKAACDRQSRDARLVGKGKKYENAAAYRAYYAGMYFGEE